MGSRQGNARSRYLLQDFRLIAVTPQLLGLPSHDLDVTLSSCAGYPFAQAFVNYLRTVPSASTIEIKSIGKVSANPDQSKHLETATTSILGLECDFVQLRSEVYADGSRIPSEVVSLACLALDPRELKLTNDLSGPFHSE